MDGAVASALILILKIEKAAHIIKDAKGTLFGRKDT